MPDGSSPSNLTPAQLSQVAYYLQSLGLLHPPERRGGGGKAVVTKAGCCPFPSEICVDAYGRVISCEPGEIPDSANCLNRFLVAPMDAPFSSIQEAYDAAKAEGHDADNPVTIFVCPGAYTEDVTMDTPGISIVAVTQNPQQEAREVTPAALGEGNTRLVGQLTVDLVSAGSLTRTVATWNGIDIRPPGGTIAVRVTGVDAQYAYIRNCIVTSDGASTLEVDNSGVDTIPSQADFQNCVFEQLGLGSEVYLIGDGVARFYDCVLSQTDPANVAALLGIGTFTALTSCILTGQAISLAGAFLDILDSKIDTGLAGVPIITALSSSVNMIDSEFQIGGPIGSLITGDALWSHNNVTFGGVSGSFAVALGGSVIQVTEEGIPNERYVTEAGTPVTLTTECNVAVGTPGAVPGTLTLPPLSARAGPIRIKQSLTSGGGVITIAAAGLDLIRVDDAPPAATTILPTPAPGSAGGLILVANLSAGYWEAYVPNGGGAAPNCLTEFLVSPVPGGGAFTTIGAAYAAAKAAGADPLFPAEILVCPGDYTEDLLLDQAGIHIIAVAQNDWDEQRTFGRGITRLFGTVTIDLTGFSPGPEQNNVAWRGIDINGGVRNGIHFTGVVFQQAFITDCRIQTGGALDAAVLMDNTGVDLPGPSQLNTIRCGIFQDSVASPAPFEVLDAVALVNDCHVQQGGGDALIVGAGAGAAFFAVGSTFSCEFEVGDTVRLANCNVLLGRFVFTDPAAVATVTQTELPFVGGTITVGAGFFIYDAITWATVPVPFDPLTAVPQAEMTPGGSDLISVGAPFAITSETNILAIAGGIAITLPLSADRNGPLTIKPAAGIVGITAITLGGDTINGAAPPFAVPAAGATFYNNPGVGWETIA